MVPRDRGLIIFADCRRLVIFAFIGLALCDLIGSDSLQAKEVLARENIRLAGNYRSPFAGRLKVYHKNKWWSVCHEEEHSGEWIQLPEVVCKILGNPGAMVYRSIKLEGGRKAKIDECKKDENFIVECDITKKQNCSEVAVISCYFPGYIGCFSDCVHAKEWCQPDFEEYNSTAETFNIQGCLNGCREEGYTYAAVSNGNRCSCSQDFSQGVGEGFVGNENCDALCEGDSIQTCGGLDTSGYRTHAIFTTQVGNCGGKLSTLQGYVYSPGFPGSYGSSEECMWKIQISEQRVELEVEILMLKLRNGDNLTLRDNRGWSKLLNTSALDLPVLFANLTSPVSIHFRSDENSIGDHGFVFKYKAINLQEGCEPPSLDNGIYTPTWPIYHPGDTIILFCFPGFENVANHSVCGENSSWSVLPECLRITCNQLPFLEKGKYFPLWPDYFFDDSVRIVCDPGFISSPEKIECGENGTWTATPKCIFSNETLCTTQRPLTSASTIGVSEFQLKNTNPQSAKKNKLLEALIVFFIIAAFVFYNTILRSYRKKKKREKELRKFLEGNRQHIISIDRRSSQTIITVSNLAKNINLQGFDIVYV